MSNHRRRRPRPAGAPVPQDYRAPRKSAAQREAEGIETIVIDFRGSEFEVPASSDDWPTTAVQAATHRRHVDAIEQILGPKQWAIFLSRFPRKRDFDEFAELLAEEMGLGTAGN
ncbi:MULTISPECIES: hypothetical protein [unclassified Nocardia]|uniref:hypothetical protein n=1 Tax=unclassified Nocardia TaxID=2637762 RepID=UPI00278C415F|nr:MULTISPECIES: hypothetical protein [unclassified Nocardia]